MNVGIVFEAHSTSVDNEAGTASGHRDCPLSELGREQAAELGERYRDRPPVDVYCSDLRRSWETGEIAFGAGGPTVRRDPRLRECDYGNLAGSPSAVIAKQAPGRVSRPFPGGESYEETCARMAEFLAEVAASPGRGELVVIGHRATQYALEHWLNEVPLPAAISAPWSWQPGWRYELDPAAVRRIGERADART